MSSLEEVARTWLTDPAWQKVFKHTVDVLEDYVCYVMVAVGAIALSVRLITTLSTGELSCLMIGLENATEQGSLLPYVTGGTHGMLAYAQTEEACIRGVWNHFMEYLPYILLLQTLILVIAEKFTFKIPRIAQRVERFYKNIVEESFFGSDPDVAEDVTDPKTSTEAISRRRQRNEICVTLKRSSVIHRVYIGKNVAECLLASFCLVLNVSFALEPREDSAKCEIPIRAFPGVVDEPGLAVFQCKGKKKSFFLLALWIQVALLAVYLLLSMCALIWCWKFRSVTNLLRTIEAARRESWAASRDDLDKDTKDNPTTLVSEKEGEDFLFLFDLLAHGCGLESTLRVLTHSDDKFYQICRPKLDPKDSIHLEEDKIKVSWRSADIERWLQQQNGHAGFEQDEEDEEGMVVRRRRYRPPSIEIDSYEVTIFPAESIRNTQTMPAAKDPASFKDGTCHYHTWFYDLQGGRTEYVVTIACMIGKSRMKGEKVVTNLVPYGPEMPVGGMQKTANTDQVEIFWDAPKGEFTKYILYIDKLDPLAERQMSSGGGGGGGGGMSRNPTFLRMPSLISSQTQGSGAGGDGGGGGGAQSARVVHNLSHKLTSYTILGLEPGEMYSVELGCKTGTVLTRGAVRDVVLTRPNPPAALVASEVAPASALLQWLPPEGGTHKCLRGYQLTVLTSVDGKTCKSMAVSKLTKSFRLTDLDPATEYECSVLSLATCPSLAAPSAVHHGSPALKKYDSVPSKASLSTPPEAVRSLRLDHATANSLTVRWEAPKQSTPVSKYRLSIQLLPSTKEEADALNKESASDPVVEDLEKDEERVKSPTTPALEGDSPEKKIATPRQLFSRKTDFVPGSGGQLTFNFSKLPDPDGSGRLYSVSARAVASVVPSGAEVVSREEEVRVATMPLKPSNLRPSVRSPSEVCWIRSATSSVRRYRVTWRRSEEGSRLSEAYVEQNEEEEELSLDLYGLEVNTTKEQDTDTPQQSFYKVNVYAVCNPSEEYPEITVESKELHEKFVFSRPKARAEGEEEEEEEKREGEPRLAVYVEEK